MRAIIYTLIITILFSCKKNELGPQCINCSDKETNTEIADLLILNEGNFGWGNGSLSLYKPNLHTITNNVYQQANNNIALGDVAQSAFQFKDYIYVVANNSNKIEVINKNNFQSTGTISGFNSPRYFLPVSDNKAYVSDLYSNSIQIVDLSNNSITGNISTNGWTEELLIYNDTVYVCDMTNDKLLIINPANDLLINSINLGRQPNSIVKDKNNKLWILCDGGINQMNPKLIKFNPQTRAIEATLTFSSITDSPNQLSINSNGDNLYFINSNIYKMSINDLALPSSPIITSNNNNFYGLGIDPLQENIYVADAIDYVQNGIVFRYSSSANLIDQFYVGIIPGKFLFIE